MTSAKCLLNVPTSKRIRLVPTLLARRRTAEVDGSLPFPPSIHSPHLNYLRNSLLERIHLIPHIFISGAAYHGIHKRHILHVQIRLQPYACFQERSSRPDRQRYQYGLLPKVRRSITNSSLVQFVPQLSHLPLLINRAQEVNFQKLPT